MFHPKDNFFMVCFTVSLALGEFFAIRMMPSHPSMNDWVLTLSGGLALVVVTWLPSLFILVLIYAALGWWD